MYICRFNKLIKKSVCELIKTDIFADAAKRNWLNNQGNEEELYPYLNELIRKKLNRTIDGIGYGKYKNRKEKTDCICYLNINGEKQVYAVELKGPSKDKAWVSKGIRDDLEKLKNLVKKKVINYGITVAIYLENYNDGTTVSYTQKLNINSSSVGVKIEIKNTQQVNSPDPTSCLRESAQAFWRWAWGR
ncbi:MAG: hypothetical protein ABSC54_05110 [Smithellaceae bacterium]|jgi:hypothetical protein